MAYETVNLFRRCLLTQMATQYLKSLQLYQNLNVFPPPAQLNALRNHLQGRQVNECNRLRVTSCIHLFIHVRKSDKK